MAGQDGPIAAAGAPAERPRDAWPGTSPDCIRLLQAVPGPLVGTAPRASAGGSLSRQPMQTPGAVTVCRALLGLTAVAVVDGDSVMPHGFETPRRHTATANSRTMSRRGSTRRSSRPPASATEPAHGTPRSAKEAQRSFVDAIAYALDQQRRAVGALTFRDVTAAFPHPPTNGPPRDDNPEPGETPASWQRSSPGATLGAAARC
jgi:hypothetical protein